MSAGEFASRNAKTVVSVVGGVLGVITSVGVIAQYAPAGVWAPLGGVLTALEALRATNVWLVRNGDLIVAAAGAVGDLVDQVEHPTAAAQAAPPGGA